MNKKKSMMADILDAAVDGDKAVHVHAVTETMHMYVHGQLRLDRCVYRCDSDNGFITFTFEDVIRIEIGLNNRVVITLE